MNAGAGRFAPSPTGPLHAGSLLAATASYLDARSRGERWLLRIDDLDRPRVARGAESRILATLEAHGLSWDGPVIRQRDRIQAYRSALDTLAGKGLLFYCTCSRKMLAGQPVYPGTCRGHSAPRRNAAVRVRVDDHQIRFDDLIAGRCNDHLRTSCGDFVVRRRDGIIAYQLATAVDDGSEEITRVVRGGDLLDNTARQIFLMECLGLSVPVYAHLPVLVDGKGRKLSKQTGAPPVDDHRPTANLLAAFAHLALDPPPEAAGWSPARLLEWGTARFDVRRIPGGEVPQVPAG
ncbi:MAG: tRNA glutamyl-Q(34) synthetase GluQRS [Pseudomonadales bacterium]|jgi:glutamyl-Q tRNA(Asp) synthetase